MKKTKVWQKAIPLSKEFIHQYGTVPGKGKVR